MFRNGKIIFLIAGYNSFKAIRFNDPDYTIRKIYFANLRTFSVFLASDICYIFLLYFTFFFKIAVNMYETSCYTRKQSISTVLCLCVK